ncbi:MAG: molybdenum cofactor guanylyltransferase [Saprospiraceae bacterium]|nr:molybdenum cofactor guanylyltransferase [Saprospiraceae bacterium]
MSIPEIRGLVLAGGFSTRMGQDKGFLPWEGIPLIQRQLECLSTVLTSVMISCRAEQADRYRPFGELLFEDRAHHGPMSGLLTAFHHSPEHAWLLLPVDRRYMSRQHVEQLLHFRNTETIATVFQDPATRTLQPLTAIWEPRATSLLIQAWQSGQYSLRQILESNPVKTLIPADSSVLKNVNRPEDLQDPV